MKVEFWRLAGRRDGEDSRLAAVDCTAVEIIKVVGHVAAIRKMVVST
jgi:hypothetical protein